MPDPDPRRRIPRTDAILADARLAAVIDELGSGAVKRAVVAAQARARTGEIAPERVADAVVADLSAGPRALRAVLNATGVVLHTNLGRAAMSDAAVLAVQAAAGYVDVEFDLATGRRSGRGQGAVAALLERVPEAEAAMIVNNGAAALLLATTALAAGDRGSVDAAAPGSVVISRGEMVEIGDGFRLPDLIESTGVRIREVGTTNRVVLADYRAAIGPDTGCLVKIHPSNFRIEGFTRSVPVAELATLGPPVVVDVGSGLLGASALLPDEPDVGSALRSGAGLVTGSGDKLLGGPQTGLILGRRDLVERLRRHPMARAVRVDKLALAAIEATLRGPATPTERFLHADPGELRERCAAVLGAIEADVVGAELVPSDGAVGGGAAPGVRLPGWAVSLPERYAVALRRGATPIVGRIEHGRCLLDLRCVPGADDRRIVAGILDAARADL